MKFRPVHLLGRLHAQLLEDPPRRVIGRDDDGAVALGLLGDLESKRMYQRFGKITDFRPNYGIVQFSIEIIHQ